MAKKTDKQKIEYLKNLVKSLLDKNKQKTTAEMSFKMPTELVIKNPLPFPKSISIDNLPETLSVRVENQKDFPKEISINNFPKPEKRPKVQDVKVLNHEPETASKWVPGVVLAATKALVHGVGEFAAKLWAQGLTVRLDATERARPLAVIIVDEHGRPVKHTGGNGVANFPMVFHNNGNPPPSGIKSGRAVVPTPGTPVVLGSTQTCKKVLITAPPTNTDQVYVGGSDVSAVNGAEKGVLLTPTGTATIEIDNVNKLYVDAKTSNDLITFIVLS